jgi:hypothetical protein
MEILQFIELHKRGTIQPNTELPIVPTHPSGMSPVDQALDHHHGILIRYFKWQGEFFQAAKRHGVEITKFTELAIEYNIKVTSFREEPSFIRCFRDQIGL